MVDAKLRLNKVEKEAIERMIKAGLFSTTEEAVRAAIIKYASDIGLLSPQHLWKQIEKYERRRITPKQLEQDLEILENEA